MTFITGHHFAIWGYFICIEVQTVHPDTAWVQFLEVFGKIDLESVYSDYRILCY